MCKYVNIISLFTIVRARNYYYDKNIKIWYYIIWPNPSPERSRMRQRLPGMPTRWMFNNTSVLLSRAAQIAPTFQPYGSHEELVQKALANWDMDSDQPVQTIELPGIQLIPMTVKITRTGKNRSRIEWGIHVSHSPATAGLSPFTRITGRKSMRAILTDLVTIGFDPTAETPTISMAYPGPYAPPLPWNPEAYLAEDRGARSLEYWRQYAFPITGATRVMRMGTMSERIPTWWL